MPSRQPRARMRSSAALASRRTVSPSPATATAAPSRATTTGVSPSPSGARSRRERRAQAPRARRGEAGEPTTTGGRRPRPRSPPGISAARRNAGGRVAGGAPSSARATGCAEWASAAATSGRTAASPHHDEPRTALGESAGLVEQHQARSASRSTTSAPLTRKPARAARPMAAVMASGVASPSAHGHVTMSSATAGRSPAAGWTATRERR